MEQLFVDIPEAISNSLVIARRCSVMAESGRQFCPHSRDEERSESNLVFRRMQVWWGDWNAMFTVRRWMLARDAASKPYFDRLEFELQTINQMEFPGIS